MNKSYDIYIYTYTLDFILFQKNVNLLHGAAKWSSRICMYPRGCTMRGRNLIYSTIGSEFPWSTKALCMWFQETEHCAACCKAILEEATKVG